MSLEGRGGSQHPFVAIICFGLDDRNVVASFNFRSIGKSFFWGKGQIYPSQDVNENDLAFFIDQIENFLQSFLSAFQKRMQEQQDYNLKDQLGDD